ncbi:hypothetical protein [Promicromonospora kroppenstedtii]|uniref:hypothetical protein n=1 Tax=Promicromonospora kroppenstedtii TaxID=440482 RepID=UPI00068496F4|nr:hypothetical protein [Promicromonospora kroppenstedtii]
MKMSMKSTEVALLGEQRPATLTLRTGVDCLISAELPGGTTIDGSGGDFYEALRELRLIVESSGRLLLCAGSRRDVHPSAMQRQWTQGRRAYALGGVFKGEKAPVVDIFDPIDVADVVSVEAQQAWYSEWLATPRGNVLR